MCFQIGQKDGSFMTIDDEIDMAQARMEGRCLYCGSEGDPMPAIDPTFIYCGTCTKLTETDYFSTLMRTAVTPRQVKDRIKRWGLFKEKQRTVFTR